MVGFCFCLGVAVFRVVVVMILQCQFFLAAADPLTGSPKRHHPFVGSCGRWEWRRRRLFTRTPKLRRRGLPVKLR